MSSAEEVAARIMAERQWPVTVTLKRPIEFGDESIASLTFREGCWKDLVGIKADGIPDDDQLMLVASRMCGKPVAALAMLKVGDIGPVREIALGFFIESLGAGKTP